MNFVADLLEKIKKGKPEGVASLDKNGRIPSSELTELKTVNNNSLLGSGNIEITGGGGDSKTNILNVVDWLDENQARIDITKGMLNNSLPYKFSNPYENYEYVIFSNLKNGTNFMGGFHSSYEGDNYIFVLGGGGNGGNSVTTVEIELLDLLKWRDMNNRSLSANISTIEFTVTPFRFSWESGIKDGVISMIYKGVEYTNLAKPDIYTPVNAVGATSRTYGGAYTNWGLPQLKLKDLQDLTLKIKATGNGYVTGIYMNPKITIRVG